MGKKMRLIDANELKKKQVNVCFDDDCESDGFGVVYVRHIDEAPTVDAAPVVHARWLHRVKKVPKPEGGYTLGPCTYCSECLKEAINLTESGYCPSCGAKMDLED